MSNETKKVADVVVDSADKVYGATIERISDRMEQTAEHFEKDKDAAKKAVNAAVEGADVVLEAVTDHISGLLKGGKVDLQAEKERAISTIDKLVEKADAYYEVITDRIADRMEKVEENVEKDLGAVKQLNSELKSNADVLKNK